MNKGKKLYEGKAKIIYEGPEKGTAIQHFKDDATAFNNQKKSTIEGKGVLNNRISEHILSNLSQIGIRNHLVKRLNMREQVIKLVEIIPIEFVIRNIATGSITKRLGIEDGTVLKLGDSDYRVVFMPGHSLDHIGIFDEANKALYCGHGLGNYKPHRYMPDPPMTLPYFDVDASIESIRKARKLNPEYLLPVHSGFLASNPSFAIDAVERVTIELGEIIKEGMSKGWSDPEIEISVCKYMFADPSKSDRSYIPLVVSYRKYYERQIMKAKKNL